MSVCSLFNREQRALIQRTDEDDKWQRTPVVPIEVAFNVIYLKAHSSILE